MSKIVKKIKTEKCPAPVREIGQPGKIHTIEMCYDNRTLIRICDKYITSIDTKTCKETSQISSRPLDVVIPRPNSKEVLIIRPSTKGTLTDCYLVSCEILPQRMPYKRRISQMNGVKFGAFNSDGSLFVGVKINRGATLDSYSVTLFSCNFVKNEIACIESPIVYPHDCAYSESLKAFIFPGSYGRIYICSETSLDVTSSYETHRGRISKTALDNSGTYIAICKYLPGKAKAIVVDRIGEPKVSIDLRLFTESVCFLGFDVAGNVVVVSKCGFVYYMDTTFITKHTFTIGYVISAACLDKKESVLYYVGMYDRTIRRASLYKFTHFASFKLLLLAYTFSEGAVLHKYYIPRDIFLLICKTAYPNYPIPRV